MLEEEQERLDFLKERYALVFERIGEIRTEKRVPAPFLNYFQNMADFLIMVAQLCECPENYERSYGNPTYAVRMLGDTYGRILSALYAMLREMITYVKEKRFEEQVILAELFVQVYTCFTCEELPTYRELQQIIYWFCSDYSELFVERLVKKAAELGAQPENLHPEDGNACQSSVISQFAAALISPMCVREDTEDAGAAINPQFVCDHSEDAAIVLDKRFLERRLGAVRVACEEYAKLAQKHNGGGNAAGGDVSTVPDVQESFTACRSHCEVERELPEEQTAKEYRGSAAQDVQLQPAAYRFSPSQRRLIEKAKEEIAQIAEQFQ